MDLSNILAKTTFVLEPPAIPASMSIINFQGLLLWVAATVLIVVSGLLIFALFRLRARTSADSVDRSTTVLDTIWTLVPVAILILLIWLTVQAVFWRGA